MIRDETKKLARLVYEVINLRTGEFFYAVNYAVNGSVHDAVGVSVGYSVTDALNLTK